VRQQPVVLVFDYRVALAGALLQAGAVEHRDVTAVRYRSYRQIERLRLRESDMSAVI